MAPKQPQNKPYSKGEASSRSSQERDFGTPGKGTKAASADRSRDKPPGTPATPDPPPTTMSGESQTHLKLWKAA